MRNDLFTGIFTALVTPMDSAGAVDDNALQSLIEWQVNEGVSGLVPCGTTGESATLSHEEHAAVVRKTVEIVQKRVPVVAGAGANATNEAIFLTQAAEQAGADAVLSVAPYYNKPSAEGMYAHFKAIHDASSVPIILYNIPGRSVVDMGDDLLARLAELPRIIGVKDATGNLARVSTLRHVAGDSFIQLSGEDMTAIGFNAMGGQGCISVTSNVMPKRLAEIQALTLAGDYQQALALHQPMVALHEAMFCTSSPAPVKYALSRMGKLSTAQCRLPIVALNEAQKQKIDAALTGLQLV